MLLTSLATLVIAQASWNPTGPKIVFTMGNGKSFTIQTDQKGSPKTTAQIVDLVKKKFYDSQRVHRVEDWVVQWGDPASKKGVDGVGGGGSGKGIPFEDSKATFKKGVVGIASTGAKVGGDSQLFVVLKDSTFLDHNYAILGKVTSGMDVVMAFKRGDTIKKAVIKK
ncbi:MAG TPA: peptidylprolyl isomerase [Fimbriimonadaceae bacterium]|nr:peptidylprolyl isomerase [Fimbriimonadaceae bacterium]